MLNLLLYLGTVLIWGSTWLPVKLQLGIVPPEVSIAYRFALASALLFAWCGLRRLPMRFPWRAHGFMALLGLFLFSGNYLLFYNGSAYMPSGLVAVVFSTIVVVNIVNGALLFGRRPERRVLLGAGFGLAGIALTFWPDLAAFDLGGGGSLGLLLCLLGTVSASFGNMVSARNQKAGIPVMPANAYGMAYGTVLMVLYAWASGSAFTFDPSPVYWLSLAYLALFGSVLGFGFYLTLLGRIGPERAAYATVLFPVIALAISTVFEGYAWTPEAVAGTALILVGNALVLVRRPVLRPKRPGRPAPPVPGSPLPR